MNLSGGDLSLHPRNELREQQTLARSSLSQPVSNRNIPGQNSTYFIVNKNLSASATLQQRVIAGALTAARISLKVSPVRGAIQQPLSQNLRRPSAQFSETQKTSYFQVIKETIHELYSLPG
jgi:hypothetical protein